MAIQGEIKTLYTDSSKQTVLLPATKTRAISNDEGIGLDALLQNLPYYDTPDVIENATVPFDADSLGGVPASSYATQTFVTNKIAQAQLGGGSGAGEIDLSGYATKDDITGLGQEIRTEITEAAEKSINLLNNHIIAGHMELIWINASPRSTFNAQSITIPSSLSPENYDSYAIVAHASINTDNLAFLPIVFCYKGQDGHILALPNNKIGRRAFSISATGNSFDFNATQYGQSGYGSATTENEYVIPMYIYGIRGVRTSPGDGPNAESGEA